MRYWESIEASNAAHEAEHDAQEQADAPQKLDNARRKRRQAARIYQDRVRDADQQERKAKQALAEVDAGQRDTDTGQDQDTETERRKRYRANQQRINRALAADAEKQSKGISKCMPAAASLCVSTPADKQSSAWPKRMP